MDEKEYIAKLQDQINQIIGAKSTLKRRKKNTKDAQREMFLTTISLLAHIVNRGGMIAADYNIDLGSYDEPFFQIIDSLIFMHFGKEAAEIIMFYIYERNNPDGTINPLYDENNNSIILDRIEDLWELVKQIIKK
jgi:hypothetical protein